LARHAKSSWSDPSTPDIDRPLSARGVRAAEALAQQLAGPDRAPDIVVCSPARRARQTLAAVQRVLPAGVEIHIEPAVYHGGTTELLAVLQQMPATAAGVLVIGHNPTLQELALRLLTSTQTNAADLARLRIKFPTAALATLSVPPGWDRLTTGCADLKSLWTPRPPST